MELGNQIKRYRKERSLSQDALAEKVYVSRQTISNWENDKSYPDINSLMLLCDTFEISLDQLVKGDVETMKQRMNMSDDERKEFNRLGNIFGFLLLLIGVTPIPLVHFLSYVGMGIWIVILLAGICAAAQVEKRKARYDIQSYREIVAFVEGTTLDEIEKAKEEGKRIYQKILLAVGTGVLALAVSLFFIWLLGV